MKAIYTTCFGWKYCKQKERAMIRKRTSWDFFLSIVIAFLIIIFVSQLLAKLDTIIIRSAGIGKNFSLIDPFKLNIAEASNAELKLVEGDLVKYSGSDAIYLIKDNGRYSFPFKKVYQAYYGNDFSRVKTISLSELSKLPLKGNVKLPPNTLVKITTDPKVYKVIEINNSSYLEWILNEAEAKSQFGSDWSKKIIDVPDVFFVDYKIATVQATKPIINSSKPVGLVEICLSLKLSEQKTAAQKLLLDECKKIGANVTEEGVVLVDLTPIPQSVTNPIETPANSTQAPVTPTPVAPTPTPTPNTNIIDSSNGPLIRVGLYYTTSLVVITANTAYFIEDQNKTILANVPANIQSTVSFNFSNKTYNLSANGVNLATNSYIRFEGKPDTVFEIVNFDNAPGWNADINDNRFLGSIEVRYASATNRLWVINELQMEDYLKGIAETSNYSPLEYQKALITAARSYAYYHYSRGTKHAAENFTVDASYDQVYRGYNSEQRLTKVVEAVEQTKGIVITYNDNPVVTPYFSWSDGHTRNWEDVWGGSIVPWCRSVKEPAGYDKTTLYGHGVGMSARGALLLASDYNYTYDRILKYYYTGIELKKIY
jgi:hypothetical protein